MAFKAHHSRDNGCLGSIFSNKTENINDRIEVL